MFNLEKAIGEWRQQMLAGGIKTPVPMEELEGHLLDEIERQRGLGLSEQKAFEISVQEIGQPKILKSEFKKIERTLMRKTLMILAGIFMILFGPAMIMPALAKHYHYGVAWDTDILWPIIVGTIILLAGMGTVVAGFKKRRA